MGWSFFSIIFLSHLLLVFFAFFEIHFSLWWLKVASVCRGSLSNSYSSAFKMKIASVQFQLQFHSFELVERAR